MHLSRLLFAVRASIWLVPLLCVAAGVALGILTLTVDRRYGYSFADFRPHPLSLVRRAA